MSHTCKYMMLPNSLHLETLYVLSVLITSDVSN
uniref:Uncharacterized protein n=1 Tax=Arundo donax TaxID=35708 RepID=A0A0A9FAU4_ARUDO